jgi:hypothetical protein
MVWRATGFVALILSLLFPAAGQAQQGDNATSNDTCAQLSVLSGRFETSSRRIVANWSFGTADGGTRPGGPFTAEHTYLPAIPILGPGPHYVLSGVIDENCSLLSGNWTATFSDGEKQRVMSGSFVAAIGPDTISIIRADDDADRPHGWVGIRYFAAVEQDVPRIIEFADTLEFHGGQIKTRTIEIADALQFHGEPDEARIVALAKALAFHGETGETRTVEIAAALEFHGEPDNARLVELAEILEFHGEPSETRTVEMVDMLRFHGENGETRTIEYVTTLEFHGDPEEERVVAFTEVLEFHGDTDEARTIELAEVLEFHGDRAMANTVQFSRILEFHGERDEARTINITDVLEYHGEPDLAGIVEFGEALEFHGEPNVPRAIELARVLEFHSEPHQPRRIELAEVLEFHGEPNEARTVEFVEMLRFHGAKPETQTVELAETLEFRGETDASQPITIANEPDSIGGGPCGTNLAADLRVVSIDLSLPESSDGITTDYIEGLRATYSAYFGRVADALDAQADCIETRLKNFQRQANQPPHSHWVKNPTVDIDAFYTNQVNATRNAALYLRQVDWELAGIEKSLKDKANFYYYDRNSPPEVADFGLVTGEQAEPAYQDGNSMTVKDFELMKKHSPANADALIDQRNLYIYGKLALRFGYLEELLPRTIDGLADWTQVEDYLTRRFMPRIASTIKRRVGELKNTHKLSESAQTDFVVPFGQFSAYAQEFARLTQLSGTPLDGGSFDKFMTGAVGHGKFDAWPDAKAVLP